MPKSTFFNLPKAKQENLITAAKNEFSRVPIYEASISNIVKSADISRGSFYQYFNDKEDVFLYVLDLHAQRNQENFIKTLEKNEGDLFSTFTETFKSTLSSFQHRENQSFFKNAFLNMNYKVGDTFTQGLREEKFKQRVQEIRTLTNVKDLNISDEKEFIYIIQILMAVTFHSVIQNFTKELPLEEAINNYEAHIQLLKKGLEKGER